MKMKSGNASCEDRTRYHQKQTLKNKMHKVGIEPCTRLPARLQYQNVVVLLNDVASHITVQGTRGIGQGTHSLSSFHEDTRVAMTWTNPSLKTRRRREVFFAVFSDGSSGASIKFSRIRNHAYHSKALDE